MSGYVLVLRGMLLQYALEHGDVCDVPDSVEAFCDEMGIGSDEIDDAIAWAEAKARDMDDAVSVGRSS